MSKSLFFSRLSFEISHALVGLLNEIKNMFINHQFFWLRWFIFFNQTSLTYLHFI